MINIKNPRLPLAKRIYEFIKNKTLVQTMDDQIIIKCPTFYDLSNDEFTELFGMKLEFIKKFNKGFEIIVKVDDQDWGHWDSIEEGRWEPDIFKAFDKFIDKNHSYIDIGAWIGGTVLYGAHLAKKCYAIEPDPIATRKLRDNIQLNKIEVDVIEKAIWINNDGVNFGTGLHGTLLGDSASSVYVKTNRIKVESIRFADLIKQKNIDDCNFIKMDVEGAEIELIPDMIDYLLENKITLYLSIHCEIIRKFKLDASKLLDVLNKYQNLYTTKLQKIDINIIKSAIDNEQTFDIIATEKEGI